MEGLAREVAIAGGMPNLTMVTVEHPVGGLNQGEIELKAEGGFPEILKACTNNPLSAQFDPTGPEEDLLEVTDCSSYGIQRYFYEKGLTDGLPIIPPIQEQVNEFLVHINLDPEAVIGCLRPKNAPATVTKLAVNAVMAGCLPEYFPVVVAAVKAMMNEEFNLHGIQTTTHCAAPLIIVNGPIRKKLNINCGSNVFGQGWKSNATIGRAVRLILMNIGGGIPGETDKATMGHPGKYSFCIGENEELSPWESLSAEKGFGPETSTVTVVGGEAPHNINDHESTTAGGLLLMITGTMAITGTSPGCQPLLILGPEHAATLSREGFAKDDVKTYIYENARIPLHKFSKENIERRLVKKFPKLYSSDNLKQMVTIAQSPNDIMIIVAGGVGKHSMYIPTFGGTRAVTTII